MYISLKTGEAQLGQRVYVDVERNFRGEKRTFVAKAVIVWVTDCGRYAKVRYAYAGINYLNPFAVTQLKKWVDGRKRQKGGAS